MPIHDMRVKIGPALLAIAVALGAGIASQALTPSPYYLAKRWSAEAIGLIGRLRGKQQKAPASAPAQQFVDTVQLPLTKQTVTLPADSGVAPIAGGIFVIGNDIVIADRLGGFFKVSDRGAKIEKLALPPLPNHVDEYLKFAGRINVNGFRVHSIRAKSEADGLRLFVSFENFLPDQKATNFELATLLVSDADLQPLGNWEVIYQSPPLFVKQKDYAGLGGGGAILVDNDKVYVSVGDYNQDSVSMPSPMAAQDKNGEFGTVESIDLATKQKTRVVDGLRNPQGLVLNSQGLIYEVEQGPKGGDKLDLITPGKNYGWPVETYGTDYTSYDWPHAPFDTSNVTFEKPVFAWVPSIAASEVIELDHFSPRWDHDLLIASLKAQSLFRVHMEAGRVVYVEPIFIGERIRDLAQLADGTLVLWTDQAHLIFLTIDTDRLAGNKRDFEVVENAALTPCMTCHHVGLTNPNHMAPSLSRVLGRKIASDSFDHYSDALKKVQGNWDADTLFAFLTDPNGFAPGTAMTYSASDADAYKIIDLLKNVD